MHPQELEMKRGDFPVSPYVLLFVGVFSVALSAIFIKWSSAPASIMGMYRLLFTVLLLIPFRPWRLQPVFIMIGSFFLFRERTTAAGLACLLAALFGTVLIGWGDIGLSGESLYGDLLSLAGAFAYSLYLLVGQSLAKTIPSTLYSFFVFLIAGILLLIYNLVNQYSLTEYALKEWGLFLLLALIPTFLGQMLFNLLLAHLNATTVSIAIIGEPILAIIMASLWLSEQPTLLQLVGGTITLLGVGIFFRTKSRERSVQK